MKAVQRMLINDPMGLVTPLIGFAGTLTVAYIVGRMVLRALRGWAERTGSRPGRILAEALRGPLAIWGLILAVHLAIQLSAIPARYTQWSARTLASLWVLSLTLMCMKLSRN